MGSPLVFSKGVRRTLKRGVKDRIRNVKDEVDGALTAND